MQKIKQEDVALRDKINTPSTVQLQDYSKINTPILMSTVQFQD